jgi:hypothetical protein
MAALLGDASSLWNYNRDIYQWEKGQAMSAVYQMQNMLLKKFGMFREDIRDLMGLATDQLDLYSIVSGLALGLINGEYFDGKKIFRVGVCGSAQGGVF